MPERRRPAEMRQLNRRAALFQAAACRPSLAAHPRPRCLCPSLSPRAGLSRCAPPSCTSTPWSTRGASWGAAAARPSSTLEVGGALSGLAVVSSRCCLPVCLPILSWPHVPTPAPLLACTVADDATALLRTLSECFLMGPLLCNRAFNSCSPEDALGVAPGGERSREGHARGGRVRALRSCPDARPRRPRPEHLAPSRPAPAAWAAPPGPQLGGAAGADENDEGVVDLMGDGPETPGTQAAAAAWQAALINQFDLGWDILLNVSSRSRRVGVLFGPAGLPARQRGAPTVHPHRPTASPAHPASAPCRLLPPSLCRSCWSSRSGWASRCGPSSCPSPLPRPSCCPSGAPRCCAWRAPSPDSSGAACRRPQTCRRWRAAAAAPSCAWRGCVGGQGSARHLSCPASPLPQACLRSSLAADAAPTCLPSLATPADALPSARHHHLRRGRRGGGGRGGLGAGAGAEGGAGRRAPAALLLPPQLS